MSTLMRREMNAGLFVRLSGLCWHSMASIINLIKFEG
jgi:hypothetical protein